MTRVESQCHSKRKGIQRYWKRKLGVILVLIPPDSHDYKKILIYYKLCCSFRNDRIRLNFLGQTAASGREVCRTFRELRPIFKVCWWFGSTKTDDSSSVLLVKLCAIVGVNFDERAGSFMWRV